MIVYRKWLNAEIIQRNGLNNGKDDGVPDVEWKPLNISELLHCILWTFSIAFLYKSSLYKVQKSSYRIHQVVNKVLQIIQHMYVGTLVQVFPFCGKKYIIRNPFTSGVCTWHLGSS